MFRFPLQAVLDARSRAEDAARGAAESSRLAAELQRRRFAGLRAHRSAVIARLRAGDAAPADHLQRIDAALRAAVETLDRLSADADRADRAWRHALRDRRVIERFRDRDRARFVADRERAEAAETEDANARVRYAPLMRR